VEKKVDKVVDGTPSARPVASLQSRLHRQGHSHRAGGGREEQGTPGGGTAPKGSSVGNDARLLLVVAQTRGEGQLAIHAADQSVSAAPVADEALDFVRFCYRRRRVGWPSLYDEMCAVASRGAYRGLGFAELAERGITFCLSDMPRLTQLLEQVIAEEQTSPEPSINPAPIKLQAVPARS
jgi:hypothetical protein